MTGLFAGFFDDAALFPPGDAPMAAAVRHTGPVTGFAHHGLLNVLLGLLPFPERTPA